MSAVEKYGILIDPSPSGIILPDMKDVPFYEVVLEKCDDNAYLVTGNIKHFPKETYSEQQIAKQYNSSRKHLSQGRCFLYAHFYCKTQPSG